MKFHRYILGQLLTGFLFSAAGMVFIAMPGMAVAAVHRLGGAGTIAVLEFVPLMAAVFVPYVLPVALLLALVSTYGRLAAQNEWTAIRMAGINPLRMLLPALLLAGGAGAGVYALNAEILPRLKVYEKTFQLEVLKSAVQSLSRGKTEVEMGDFFLSSTMRDPDRPEIFYDCYIQLPAGEDGESGGIMADAVRFEFDDSTLTAHLYGGRGSAAAFEGGFDYAKVVRDLDELVGETKRHDFRSARYQTSSQLLESLAKLDEDEPRARVQAAYLEALGAPPPEGFLERWQRPRRRLLYAWHQRMANGATCLMFVLVGVSTGVMLRKGTQLSALAVAVGYAMVYWITSLRLGKQLAQSGTIEAWVGAWGPLAVFSVVGVWLTLRAFRE